MKNLENSEDEGEISNHQAKLEEVMAEITEENKIAVELGACDSHVEVKRQTDLSRYCRMAFINDILVNDINHLN